MRILITTTVNILGAIKYRSLLQDGLKNHSGPIGAMFKQWAVRYRTFIQRRFNTFSRGGGDWPDLAPATKAARRKGRKSSKNAGKVSILRDTNTLYLATNPVFNGMPGQLERKEVSAIIVGYGGPLEHKSGGVTVAKLAAIHQEGNSRLPARKIIVDPDAATLNGMAADGRNALAALKKQAGLK